MRPKIKLLPRRLNDKPPYVLYPTRAARRAVRELWRRRDGARASELGAVETAVLPWGLPLDLYPDEAVGYTVLTARVFDPCVSEALHRLIDPGDLAVDAGAHVGYMTSIAASRAAAEGTVISYEPHPDLFRLLASNAGRWAEQPSLARVDARQAALSDRTGEAELTVGSALHANMGLASLRHGATGDDSVEFATVETRRLDDELGERSVGVLKVDVEGHEAKVLAGARELIERRGVRDILFEHQDGYPSPVTEQLERSGYRIFSLDNDLLGLCVGPPEERSSGWWGPSYLATLDPQRATARLTPGGWQLEGCAPRAWSRFARLVVGALLRRR